MAVLPMPHTRAAARVCPAPIMALVKWAMLALFANAKLATREHFVNTVSFDLFITFFCTFAERTALPLDSLLFCVNFPKMKH